MENIATSDDFALLVRQHRRKLKLSQAQLAAKVGVSRQWIIDIEKGKPRAELALSLRVLQELGIKLQVKAGPTPAPSRVDRVAGEEKIRDLAKSFNFL